MIILKISGAIFLAIFSFGGSNCMVALLLDSTERSISIVQMDGISRWTVAAPALMQQELVVRFHFLPPGAVKILTLLNQIMFVILPACQIVTAIPHWRNWFD